MKPSGGHDEDQREVQRDDRHDQSLDDARDASHDEDLTDEPGDIEDPDEHDEPEPRPLIPADPEAQMIQRARQRYGSVGVFVAGGMLGIDKILGRRVKEEAPVVWEASGEPGDIDSHGIVVPIDDNSEAVSKPTKAQRKVRKRRNAEST